MSANDDLSSEQIEQLSKVFRAEAVEHIKNIAEVLFAAEDGALADKAEGINRAFREAHSLKGSAGTLGFNRIATMAHSFEDALGHLKPPRSEKLSAKRLETLLQALETIRQGVFTSSPGDDELSDREQVTMRKLEAAFKLASGNSGAEDAIRPTPEGDQSPVPTQQKSGVSTGQIDAKQDFIRVSEKRIDAVISQFGELFETSLQLESLKHDLSTNIHEANRLTEAVSVLLTRLEDTPHEAEMMELLDIARNLSILSKSADTKFNANQRELTKFIQRSQDALRELRIAPISNLNLTIRNQVRETSNSTGKRVALTMRGGEYSVDRAILDAIEKPLIHLIRNAIDHGIEPPETRKKAGKSEEGHLTIEGRHLGDAVELHISDDGHGINPQKIRDKLIRDYQMDADRSERLTDAQLYDYLFEPGFSTSQQVSQISGRGVGLDVVKYTIEHLGGEVSLQSELGKGSEFVLRLPLTMSSIKCLLVESGGQTLAIPAANISRVTVLESGHILTIGGGNVIMAEDEQVPITTFKEILYPDKFSDANEARDSRFAAIVRFGNRKYAFGFDRIFEYTQLVIKPLGDLLERVPNVSGLALLGTGKLCLVLNPPDLIRSASGTFSHLNARPSSIPQQKKSHTILVVDDSIAIRTMQQTLLESEGFTVLMAADGLQALQMMGNNEVDLVISDVQMPNMSGFELTRAIRSRKKFKTTPVILVTSLGSPEDIREGMDAGADAHIVKKELNRSELVATIGQLL